MKILEKNLVELHLIQVAHKPLVRSSTQRQRIRGATESERMADIRQVLVEHVFQYENIKSNMLCAWNNQEMVCAGAVRYPMTLRTLRKDFVLKMFCLIQNLCRPAVKQRSNLRR